MVAGGCLIMVGVGLSPTKNHYILIISIHGWFMSYCCVLIDGRSYFAVRTVVNTPSISPKYLWWVYLIGFPMEFSTPFISHSISFLFPFNSSSSRANAAWFLGLLRNRRWPCDLLIAKLELPPGTQEQHQLLASFQQHQLKGRKWKTNIKSRKAIICR